MFLLEKDPQACSGGENEKRRKDDALHNSVRPTAITNRKLTKCTFSPKNSYLILIKTKYGK